MAAQQENCNKSVAKTVNDDQNEDEFGPQLINKLEVNISIQFILIKIRKTAKF